VIDFMATLPKKPDLFENIRFGRIFMVVLGIVFAVGMVSPGRAMEFSPPNHSCLEKKSDKSMIQGEVGYLWGKHEIGLRCADNGLLPSGKRTPSMNCAIFGLMGGTFATSDLALRAHARIGLPLTTYRSNFYFNGVALGWDTLPKYFDADLCAIYHFDLGTMPYSAGLVGGYRYMRLEYDSHRTTAWSDSFFDYFHVHIPYLGVYYAHSDLLSSLVRLEILFTPLTFSTIDFTQTLGGVATKVDASSTSGQWFNAVFSMSRKLSGGFFAGASTEFLYLNQAASARAQRQESVTSYSLDSRIHSFTAFAHILYTF
jgi:hypothetical protein